MIIRQKTVKCKLSEGPNGTTTLACFGLIPVLSPQSCPPCDHRGPPSELGRCSISDTTLKTLPRLESNPYSPLSADLAYWFYLAPLA